MICPNCGDDPCGKWAGCPPAADEIERLRETLGWYADAKNFQYTGWQGDMAPPPVLQDNGKRARAALPDKEG